MHTLIYIILALFLFNSFNAITVEEIEILCSLNLSVPCGQFCQYSGYCQNGRPSLLQLYNLQTATFPESIIKLTLLRGLRIYMATSTGTIPSSLCNLHLLDTLSITSTSFGGTVPDCIWKMQLKTLALTDSIFQGTVPTINNPVLSQFFLTHNLFSGSLPILNTPMLGYVDMSSNTFTGTIPSSYIISWYTILDNNKLSGSLPNNNSSTSLIKFSANNNFLSGYIPFYNNNKTNITTYLWVSGNLYNDLNLQSNYFRSDSIRNVNLRNNRIPAHILKNTYYQNIDVQDQDIDECLLNRYVCGLNSYCSDGWWPRMSYTCSCISGYKPSGDTDGSCVDINECFSKNACSYGRCVNVPGSYFCCNDSSYNPTPDIDNSSCLNCFDKKEYTYLIDPTKLNSSSLGLLPIHGYADCFGECTDGTSFMKRVSSSQYCNNNDIIANYCSYPCTNIYGITSRIETIKTLHTELLRGNYLNQLIFNNSMSSNIKRNNNDFNVTMDLLSKTSTMTLVCLTQCDNVEKLAISILPNASFKTSIVNGILTITATDKPKLPLLGIILISIAAAIILLCVLFYLQNRDSTLYVLPKEVADSIRMPFFGRLTWKTNDDSKSDIGASGLFYSTEYKGLIPFGLSSVPIHKITRIYNPTLVSNFVGNYRVQKERLNEKLFSSQGWATGPDKNLKTIVYERYMSLCRSYSWYDPEEPVILPFYHGTDVWTARKICGTGFATISSLDPGWYGKGMYFTSDPIYCLPYCATRTKPAIVVAYVLPGNTYPVTESSDGEKSLVGKPIMSGYQSHYVSTNNAGGIYSFNSKQEIRLDGTNTNANINVNKNKNVYDEIVIPQESQILPLYVVELDSDVLGPLCGEFAGIN